MRERGCRRPRSPVEERAHLRNAGERVAHAERDQLARVRRLEQQVAGKRGAARVVALTRDAEAAEHGADRQRQALQVASGDVVESLARRDHQHLDRLQAGLGERARRQQRKRRVDSLQPLDVDRERVEEDVRQRVAGDLRQIRIFAAAGAFARRLVHPAGTDDKDPVGAEMDRRRDRRRLAHRAVTAVLALAGDVERDRRKDERDRRRREQMLHGDRGSHREPLRARPRHDVDQRVVERHVQARSVARCGDRKRMEMALGHDAVQPAGVDQVVEQRLER